MITNNNLSPINLNSTVSTQTFFNNYFKPNFIVSPNIDAAVIGFLEQIADSKEAARLIASAVIYTSLAQNIDPMSTLEKFARLQKPELTSYLVKFLNLNRVGTSYLGINNNPTVSKYVARMILP
jgi:hypothetical protein